jgi:MOSC domain-containing protein YiiM
MNMHLTFDELQTKMAELGQSPYNHGILEMIVCRPTVDERRVLELGQLDLVDGLVGDTWQARGSRHTEDGRAHPEMQIAIMNTRVIQTVAQERERWPLAGDQLFVDLDLSHENLPVGTQLVVGTAVLEITAKLHAGCSKFTERFGPAAIRWVNSPEGRQQRRRGVYARVVQPGRIQVGDAILVRQPAAKPSRSMD